MLKFVVVGMIFVMSAPTNAFASTEFPACFSPPVRQDNSWQNWVANNQCSFQVTIKFETQGSDGKIQNQIAFAEACKTTLVIQTFKSDIVGGFSYQWTQPAAPSECGERPKQLQGTATPSIRSSGPSDDLTSRLNKARGDAVGYDQRAARNTQDLIKAGRADADELAEERRKLEEDERLNALRREQIRKEQQETAADGANEFIGGFIQGLNSVNSGRNYNPAPPSVRAPAPAPATDGWCRQVYGNNSSACGRP
jgi:hypothetical protein